MNWVQTLVDAIGLGSVYALVAIGLALIFGVMRLVNFAHGELITAAGYTLVVASSLPVPFAVALAVIVAVALAWLMERVAFRRLRDAPPVPVRLIWWRDDSHPATRDVVGLLTELYRRGAYSRAAGTSR